MDAGDASCTNSNQTPNTRKNYQADTRRVLTSVVKREKTLTYSYGHQTVTKCERMWGSQNNQDVGLEAAII